MASSYSHSLKALIVFRNLIYPELMRGVHVYRLEGGGEEEVEREYVFRNEGDYYEEIGLCSRMLTLKGFCASAHFEGMMNGVWLCIYVFDSGRHCRPDLKCIPTVLSIYRNPKLESIPILANDLHTIYRLGSAVGTKEPFQTSTEEASEGKNDDNDPHLRGTKHISGLDLNRLPYSHLNRLPYSQTENQEFSHNGLERKKKRAASEDIARLALEDLAKYFDLPIVEASKNLKVGLTVLKRKCREFGIPRWPHRKIKSLDGLIRDLQDEVERQREDKKAAMVVAKRQKMIEKEKENIERKPFMEIQRETKKFRQDIFKKRHRARALENESRTLPLF